MVLLTGGASRALNQPRINQGHVSTREGSALEWDCMAVEDELRSEVRRLVRGEGNVADLRRWLSDHGVALATTRDREAFALDGTAWLLISEYDLGKATEDEVRDELRSALGGQASPTPMPVTAAPTSR